MGSEVNGKKVMRFNCHQKKLKYLLGTVAQTLKGG